MSETRKGEGKGERDRRWMDEATAATPVAVTTSRRVNGEGAVTERNRNRDGEGTVRREAERNRQSNRNGSGGAVKLGDAWPTSIPDPTGPGMWYWFCLSSARASLILAEAKANAQHRRTRHK